ncbi:hypothetical protein OIK40_08015 [Erythrobacter sp. sf7]|uniref:Uncharacterized protein n=1 Tax=Erythrobacter fulvus TaxID=2987523 RepID=A0ABT5JP68_9SPHN|nr:hypothetical protein [Erythrobacter fulvus]MDC8754583.1 hypothetical protein [Erythrobacter fulvus]
MRQAIYNVAVSAPGILVPNAIGVAGIAASLYPDATRKLVGGMTVEQVRLWAAAGIVVFLLYWVLRLALKPAPTSEEQPQIMAVSATGDRSVAFNGTNNGTIDTGDKHIHHAPPPFELTQQFMTDALAKLKAQAGDQTVIAFLSAGPDPEHFAMANSFAKFLADQGFEIAQRRHVNQGGIPGMAEKPFKIMAWGTLLAVGFDPT